ncbi:hypothetical protein M9H77_06644 [Catharanthus roseus]|uniref:Uncharacterized protein n=1 Tax=Catharanthus roseus TaxID=4058 RepID=A0ACC0BSP3_CATRO|nr:hypothetical protein M9H77_06644 [Catharanthus roseus]
MAHGRKRKYSEDPSAQPSTSCQAPMAWKKPPDDPREQLELNVEKLHPSLRAATAITSIFHERFLRGYCTYSQRDLMGDIRKDGWGPKKHTSGSIYFTESLAKKELEKLDKHQSGRRKGSTWIIIRKIPGGVRRRSVYGAGSKAAHLRVETPIILCCVDMLRRDEAIVLSVFDAFDEYMRRFLEQNHLVYIPPPPMLDLIRAAMGTVASISSPPVPVADLVALVPDGVGRSSSTPSPSIRSPSIDDILPPSSDPKED